MRPTTAVILAGAALLILAAGCASKNQIVLLSDPDGKAGSLEVTTRGGTQVVDQAGYSVEVTSAAAVPPEPARMDDETLRRDFGGALAAEPKPPVRFVLYFETGTSDLTRESEAKLADVFVAIEERTSSDISIVGHTDRVGTSESNQALSLERAEALGRILMERGVDMSTVEITSHGETNPLVPTPDGVEEPRNRRVEVIVR